MKIKKRARWIPHRDPWQNNMERREMEWSHVTGRFMVIFLTALIICIGLNLVIRSQNMYQYTLDASQALSDSSSLVDEDDVTKEMGDYMMHKSDKMSLMSKSEYKPEQVFTKKADAMMHRLRKTADIAALAGLISLLGTIACYFFLIRWRKKRDHMRYFRYTVAAVLITAGCIAVSKIIRPICTLTWMKLAGGSAPEGDLISLIINQDFFRQEGIIELIVEAAALAVFGYITWEIAGNKRLFKETY